MACSQSGPKQVLGCVSDSCSARSHAGSRSGTKCPSQELKIYTSLLTREGSPLVYVLRQINCIRARLMTLGRALRSPFADICLFQMSKIQNCELITQNNNKGTIYRAAGEGASLYGSNPHSDPFVVLL